MNTSRHDKNSRNTLSFERPCRVAFAAILCFSILFSSASRMSGAFIPQLVNSSTIPLNGDLNPYGVAFVPNGFPAGGAIAPGDILVSNFNNSANLQGLGTTVVKLTPSGPIAAPGAAVTFFTSTQSGLSTALGVLKGGFVLVGNVPTTDGTIGTIGQGALQVIDRNGNVVQTWTDPVYLDGPWDLAIDDQGSEAHVFVSNVLNGTVRRASTDPVSLDGPWDLAIDDQGSEAHVFVSNVLNGTVVRIDLTVDSSSVTVSKKTVIATGYAHVPNTAALILGPTGLAYDAWADTLYVASTADNKIYSVSDATHRDNSTKL